MSPPKIPTRTDAYIACDCGGTASIVAVEPIPHNLDSMRHTYHCGACGTDARFDVFKKDVLLKAGPKTGTAKAAASSAARKARR